ncbi:MAG: matrixin family metalloprotease [Nitrososphaeraceae archaeon]
MEVETLADLESQKNLLKYINLSLKKHVTELQTENHVINKLITHSFSGKSSYASGKIILGVLCAISIFLLTQQVFSYSIIDFGNDDATPMKTKYVIDNLQGDKVKTSLSWKIVSGIPLAVNVVNSDIVSQDKINAIKNAILSDENVQIDDALVDKETKSTLTYYKGWTGALQQASTHSTIYAIPSSFNIIESSKGEGDILITLTNGRDSDGYTGYTKSISNGDEILKSYITIYDVDSLTEEQLSIITRHEFGHAIGLAHSTASEDLMAPSINTPYPFVSECDVDAIVALYNGKRTSEVVCEK